MYVFSVPVKDGDMNAFQKGTVTVDRLRGQLRGCLQITGGVMEFLHHRNGVFLLGLRKKSN